MSLKLDICIELHSVRLQSTVTSDFFNNILNEETIITKLSKSKHIFINLSLNHIDSLN